MRTLKDIAVANLRSADTLFKNDSSNEITINHVAYFLQQAAELYIKHYIENMGIRYPNTHDILELLELAAECR